MNGPLFEVQVSQIHDLTPRVKELVLCATGPGKLPQWNAGAHVPLYLPSTGRVPIIRHYSLISGKALEDDQSNTYRIAVQREVKERGPLVWIWMGHPDRADESKIPETDWLDDPHWKTVSGSFHINADYVSMHENLLDQTHFPFLHPGAIGTPEYARSKLDVRLENGEIVIDRALLNSPPPGVYAMPTGLTDQPVNRFSEAKFVSPALHRAFAKIVDPSDEVNGPKTYRFNITHIFTPQTQHSIHYWWFCSRDFKLDDQAIDEHLLTASNQAYKEDVDALEWIMDNLLSDAETQFDLHFAPDKPGLMMRQHLDHLAKQEG